ncbi:MAG: hypothetical protein M3R55_11030 [Acidobacteriota bacterium]|nr:hypothetical protein [Acidobacteriota bacterium]
MIVAVLFTAACAGSMPPPPSRLQTPGIKTGTTPFRKQDIASLEGSPFGPRIMQIAGGGEHGGLLIVAEHGLRWIDRDGATRRERLFPTPMFRHRLLALPDGRQGIGGLALRPNAAAVMDLEGRGVLRIDLGRRYDVPQFANVIGDSANEMILPGALDARIISLEGALLGRVSIPTYASIKTVVQADDDPEYEIAFVKTSLRAGPIEAVIMNSDGSRISQWRDTEGGWLSFVPELGPRTLWGLTREGFTAWDARGTRVRNFPAADVDYLRYVIGATFEGHTALVASGGANSNVSVLCVFDNQRRLVFQEVYPSRTYAIFAPPDGDHFYVGADDRVVRYSIAAPPRGNFK